jgi:plasmid stabilization system protein ParE
MKIVFDDEALEDLRSIQAWITKDSPRAAVAIAAKIFDKVEYLLEPELTNMDARDLIRERTN